MLRGLLLLAVSLVFIAAATAPVGAEGEGVAANGSATPAVNRSATPGPPSSAALAIEFALRHEKPPLRLVDAPLTDLVRSVQDAVWINVVLDPAVDRGARVTHTAEGEPLGPSLERALGPLGLEARVWSDVLLIGPRGAALPPPAERTLAGALRAYTLHHAQRPLAEVVDELATLARVSFLLTPAAVERMRAATLTLRVRNLPLHHLLTVVCHQVGVAWTPRGEAVWIHAPGEQPPP